MQVQIIDPQDGSVKGVLDTREDFNLQNLLNGGQENFFISDTLSSEDPNVLFNLQPPPSFSDQPMVWGQLDKNGGLDMFLALTTGDNSFPFAHLDVFRSAVDGSGGPPSGSGTLTRANKLPPSVGWGTAP